MANPDTPNGFTACGPIVRTNTYQSLADDAAAIFIGDAVKPTAEGYVEPADADDSLIVGASLDYAAASTTTDIGVLDHPQQEFVAQDDGSGTPAVADRNLNFNHVATAGSTTTLMSAHEIAYSTGTSSAAGFRFINFVKNPAYSVADNARMRVFVNFADHKYTLATGI